MDITMITRYEAGGLSPMKRAGTAVSLRFPNVVESPSDFDSRRESGHGVRGPESGKIKRRVLKKRRGDEAEDGRS